MIKHRTEIVNYNRRAVSGYRDQREVQRILRQQNVSRRITTAKIKRTEQQIIKRDQVEGQNLRRQLKDLLQKLRKSYLEEVHNHTNWIVFLVILNNQKFFCIIIKIRELFDEKVRQVDFYTEVAKNATEDTNYFLNVGIFRM